MTYLITKAYCVRIDIIDLKSSEIETFRDDITIMRCTYKLEKILASKIDMLDDPNYKEGIIRKALIAKENLYEFENDNAALLFYEVIE